MHLVKAISVISWILFFSGGVVPSQNIGVSWLTLQEAEMAAKKEPKPILIDLYTDWCGWCKVMDKKTYANRNVSGYLRDKFYTVKLNAESTEPISWGGKVFYFNQANQTNNIALYLTGGRLAYPTTVIIDASDAEPQAIPGYLNPKQIEIFLKYFGEHKFGQIKFEEYQKVFKAEWK
jgi:thioredoxin-related protein